MITKISPKFNSIKQVSSSDSLAQRVAFTQPLAHSRPASTTVPGLEVPDLEIRPTSM